MNQRSLYVLAAGAALVVLVNAIVLIGVAWNRSGQPEAELRLSERELGLPYAWRDREENSGLALALRWRVAPEPMPGEEDVQFEQSSYSPTHWLDEQHLKALGFDLRQSPDEPYRRRYREAAREVWLALELDGPAHARSLHRAEQSLTKARQSLDEHPDDRDHQAAVRGAEQHLKSVREDWSRLVAIDADLDPEALRARHPDRQRIAVVHGRVRAGWHYEKAGAAQQRQWRGYVEAVSVDSIHVPLSLHARFEAQVQQRGWQSGERSGRYEVTVAYGKRREPWVVSVQAGTSAAE